MARPRNNAPVRRPNPFESDLTLTGESAIDRLVLARLQRLGIEPARLCTDAVFVRRAFLDIIGTLPTEREARTFLAEPGPGKRQVLVDHLLERSEFADYWSLKWADLLRVKAEFPINLWPNAVQGYHRWIRTSIRENVPYDRFVRELLTSSGSNFRVPPVNFHRAVQDKRPQGIAQALALTFMGTRSENWPAERAEGLAEFFSQLAFKPTGEWKEEIIHHDAGKAAAGPPAAIFPDGTSARIAHGRDPRQALADWLIDAKNPWFAKNLVNRAWSWLLGRGIIHEPDDIRPDNPAKNPELLAYLEREFVAGRWDIKRLFRLILNSKTYQLSCIPRSRHPEAEPSFANYGLRRLEAEVLIDALCQITGTREKYTSPIPEPFTFIPEEQRSITLADGSITSSFLEMFGRPARDTGLESERNNRPTPAQRLHLLNSSHIQRKIEQSRKLNELFGSKAAPREIVTRLYLTVLSRYPTDEELRVTGAYAQSDTLKGREMLVDLTWALVNSVEFLYRH
jgi:hypothetical protein